jgi:cytochrome c peroxidase
MTEFNPMPAVAALVAALVATLALAATAPPATPPAAAPSATPAVPSTTPAPAAAAPGDPVRAGLLLFNDPSLSGGGRFACATCHPRAGHTDSRTYVGLDVVPDGTTEGRSTPLLWGARDTGPYSWAGGMTLKENIRGMIVDRMKGREPTGTQLDQLAAYVLSLDLPPNVNLNSDGTPSAAAPAAARRGYEVFLKASCNICHAPPGFSKADSEDIGSGGTFSVPSLRGLSGTAPYFHDGRFATLRVLLPAKLKLLQELGVTDALTNDDIEDLLAFLSAL